MANNCFGVTFTAYCPDGSEHTGDAGDYFAGLGMPLSGGDGPDQATIAGQGDCASLAGQHYETYTCPPLAISPLADSQIIQKRRIPPLGPKATMRRATGEKKASGVPVNLLIPIAFAGVGALVSKNKVKGAILGLVIPFVVIEGMELLRGGIAKEGTSK